ncbi:MAG TPA: peptidoglycan DD-metalloendopeptidase family protein [Candidatus Limnocylindrales bacterium]|jgi:murein DD-endopeptidase MepM/ murein hydrolase activator NlpD
MVVLAGGLFVSVPPPQANADALSDAYAQQKALQKQIAAQKAQIAALSQSQAALTTKIASTKTTLDGVVSDLTGVKADIVAMVVGVAKSQAAVDELEATVAQLDRQLADLQQQQETKQTQLDARKAMLAERIRTAYDTDRTSLLQSLLTSADFTDVLSEVSYHLDFADQDKALADEIVQDQQVLGVLQQNTALARTQADDLRTAADAQKANLDKQLADLSAAKAKLQALQTQYTQLLAAQQAQQRDLASKQVALRARLAAEARSEAALQSKINKLVQEALQQGGIPSQYNGTLRWPMGGVITQPFGCTGFYLEPPYGNCAHFHTGIDIATTYGTPVRAAGPGKVVYAGRAPYDPSYIVIIAHSSHLTTWYVHIQTRIPVHVGQYVSTGQVVGYEGCTGWCTGPHLHWSVQLNGTWANPRLFV